MRQIILVFSILLISLCTNQSNTQIANPAAVYCDDNDGIIGFSSTIEGQAGYCILSASKVCEEWEYFRSESQNCSGPITYIDVSPKNAKKLIDENPELIVVDVSPYYNDGHLPRAISIPLASLDSQISTLSMEAPYLVYCHGDSPSISGSNTLVNAGFSPVFRLVGNYGAWTIEGYPTE